MRDQGHGSARNYLLSESRTRAKESVVRRSADRGSRCPGSDRLLRRTRPAVARSTRSRTPVTLVETCSPSTAAASSFASLTTRSRRVSRPLRATRNAARAREPHSTRAAGSPAGSGTVPCEIAGAARIASGHLGGLAGQLTCLVGERLKRPGLELRALRVQALDPVPADRGGVGRAHRRPPRLGQRLAVRRVEPALGLLALPLLAGELGAALGRAPRARRTRSNGRDRSNARQLGRALGDRRRAPLEIRERLDLGGQLQVGRLQLARERHQVRAHRVASSSAPSIQATASASAAGSDDLTTTSTSLPVAVEARVRADEHARVTVLHRFQHGHDPALGRAIRAPPGRDRRTAAQLVGDELEHRLHLGREAGQHVDVRDREPGRAAQRVLQRAAAGRQPSPPASRSRDRRGSARAAVAPGRRRAPARRRRRRRAPRASRRRACRRDPPVTRTTSASAPCARTKPAMCSMSSGIAAISRTERPSCSSRRASQDAFVFWTSPETSSFPIVTIAAEGTPSRLEAWRRWRSCRHGGPSSAA